MYEGDGLNKTGNDKLDHEILRWFNNRMIELVDLYIDIGDDSGWDEDYLMECFPRNFVEDNLALCKRIILDIKDILESDFVYTNMRPLYRYVLFHVITSEIGFINEAEESSFEETFSPISAELVKEMN